MPPPKVSVIIPIYNIERYVKNCIYSILTQTLTDYEVIIVNDGSTDKSIEIIKSIVQDDRRFIFVEQKNQGQGCARNNGIERARADYISFIDGDDYVDKNYLRSLYETTIKHDVMMCSCDVFQASRVGHLLKCVPYCRKIVTWEDAVKDILNGHSLGSPCNKIYHKSLFNGVRFPDTGYYEDVITNILLLLKNKPKKFMHIKHSLYYYVQRGDSSSNAINKTKITDFIKALNNTNLHLKEYGVYKKFKSAYEAHYTISISGLMRKIVRHNVNCSQNMFQLYKMFDKNVLKTVIAKFFLRHYKSSRLDIRHIVALSLLSSGRLGRAIYRKISIIYLKYGH